MIFQGYLIALIITVAISLVMLYFVRKRGKSQLITAFKATIWCITIWCIALIIEILVINFISQEYAVYVDYFTYLPVVFLPVALFFVSYIFMNKEIHFKKRYLLLFVIPVITMIVIFTNGFHNLFYKYFSITTSETIFGPYFYIHSIYTYGLFAVDLVMLIRTSIKQSSLVSKQSVLIIIGSLFPILINMSGLFGIFGGSNVFITPISFIITISFFMIAIFKYNFLNVTPIALKRIVNQMSDLYLVLNTDYNIIDCNEPFEKTFSVEKQDLIGKNFSDMPFSKKIQTKKSSFKEYLKKSQYSEKVYRLAATIKNTNRHFNIEVSGIYEDGQCIGILILFKDITQHILDMEDLEKNKTILMERERLASLGQMIGGIAHNLKTPIMSISGAADGLEDLVNEYNQSIDDPEVTKDDHHAIAADMIDWISKIRTYDAYMSDIITAVKGQAVNMNEETPVVFTIEELINRVNILMKHELKNALITLNIDYKIDTKTKIFGNINSLVQVLDNLISNAIQAYNGKQNQSIDLVVSSKDEQILISVIDYGSGISEEVQSKLFTQMITTKGQNGTGLGLFMSYSTIKGHFGGDMTFESEVGKGTKFNILLPKSANH